MRMDGPNPSWLRDVPSVGRRPIRWRAGPSLGSPAMVETTPRHDWTTDDALALLERPFHDLLHEAQQVHRAGFRPDVVEGAILLSIKTGACPEDCAYCPQSAKWNTGLEPERLMETD